MRIAICYSGLGSRLNRYIHLVENQLSTLSTCDTDLFFSCWADGPSQEELTNSVKLLIARLNSKNIRLVKLEVVGQSYPPIKSNYNNLWSKGNSVSAINGMFTSMKNADKLRQQEEKENNFKYDIVIKSRPDISIDGPVDLSSIKEILTSEAMVVVPKGWNWFNHWHGTGGMLNDQLFFSTPDLMTLINDVDIDKCCEEGSRFHPESIMWWRVAKQVPIPDHLKDKEIPWYRFMLFDMDLQNKGKEMFNPAHIFPQENIEKFKLDKILESINVKPNIQN